MSSIDFDGYYGQSNFQEAWRLVSFLPSWWYFCFSLIMCSVEGVTGHIFHLFRYTHFTILIEVFIFKSLQSSAAHQFELKAGSRRFNLFQLGNECAPSVAVQERLHFNRLQSVFGLKFPIYSSVLPLHCILLGSNSGGSMQSYMTSLLCLNKCRHTLRFMNERSSVQVVTCKPVAKDSFRFSRKTSWLLSHVLQYIHQPLNHNAGKG